MSYELHLHCQSKNLRKNPNFKWIRNFSLVSPFVHSKMADGQYVSVKDSSRKKAHYWDHTKQVAPKASIGIDKRTRFLSLRSDELLSGFGRISLQDLFASAFSWLLAADHPTLIPTVSSFGLVDNNSSII